MFEDDGNDVWTFTNDVFTRLNADLKNASKMMSIKEARFLVDLYYGIQKFRIQAQNQVSSAGEEPIAVLSWVKGNARSIEDDIKTSLGLFARQYNVGQWLQGICGIGPVLSAGFLSSFDVRPRMIGPCDCKDSYQDKARGPGQRVFRPNRGLPDENGNLSFICTGRTGKKVCGKEKLIHKDNKKSRDGIVMVSTAGSYLRFAGIDPTSKWESGERRPWNARLKTLCFKAGESFVKVQNRESDYYGKLYAKRKEYETAKNLAGDYSEQAALGADRVGKSTEAYKHYIEGKLPPGHIHSRVRRYAVKMFLSHLHEVSYRDFYREDPPLPYVFIHTDGNHTHYLPPPVVDVKGKSLRELYGE